MMILAIKTSNRFLSYKLFDMADERILAKGKCYRIGLSDSFIIHAKSDCDFIVIEKDIYNFDLAVQEVMKVLTSADNGVIPDIGSIAAIGHHIIPDVDKLDECTIINDNVISEINECIINSELYDASFFECIKAFKRITPNIPMFAISDNAFLKTASNYDVYRNIASDISKKHDLCKAALQGISHRYAAQKTAEILNCPTKDMKIISCHLGLQPSICAIKNGRCIDMTNVAFQTGDRAKYIVRNGYFLEALDFIDINDTSNSGYDMDEYCNHVKKAIAEYMTVMGGLDVLVFTSVSGEKSIPVRENILKEMEEYTGVLIDWTKNENRENELIISLDESKIKVLVIQENAELAIAKETYKLCAV